MSMVSSPKSRSELLSLLSEACELEHGLACSYLYAAFSLKHDLSEGDITWEQLQLVRKWAAQIFFVASEEMLHLAQAWNLLIAIGGTPYYLRPAFPQPAKYYPLNVKLALEPFGEIALKRFIQYEIPQGLAGSCVINRVMSGAPVDERGNYSSVGELYARIRRGFETIPEEQLFIGDKNCQLGASEVDFPDIVRVVNRQTAVKAIRMIVEQGEGTESDSQNAHYGVFVGVLNEYEAENKRSRADGRPFVPVRPAATNPVMPEQLVQPGGDVTPLVGDYALGVAALFDELYILMLRQLQFVFTTGRSSDARFSWFLRTAIQIMPVVIKPLGEALTLIPTEGRAGETAGATFRLRRHVPLPADLNLAWRIATERYDELIDQAVDLAAAPQAPPALHRASESLRRLRQEV